MGGGSNGAGVYATDDADLLISNSSFSGNTTSGTNYGGSEGGAVYGGSGSTLTITGSTFPGNSVRATGTGTGGSGRGGAVFGGLGSTLTISNSTFSGNSVTGSGHFAYANGGAVCSGAGILTISNSTFSGNRASGAATNDNNGDYLRGESYGGAVALGRGSGGGMLANNIFWGNSASSGSQVSGGTNNTLRLTHNLIGGGSAGLSGISSSRVTNTVTASSHEDIFVSTTPGDANYLRLKTGSPAIDAGNNDWIDGNADAYATGDETGLTDLAGNARLKGSRVDLGAYEYDATEETEDRPTEGRVLGVLPSARSSIAFTNPAGEVLQLQGISKPTTLIVHSVSGREQFRTVLSTGSDEVNIRTLPPGLYILIFETAEGRHTERLLKR